MENSLPSVLAARNAVYMHALFTLAESPETTIATTARELLLNLPTRPLLVQQLQQFCPDPSTPAAFTAVAPKPLAEALDLAAMSPFRLAYTLQALHALLRPSLNARSPAALFFRRGFVAAGGLDFLLQVRVPFYLFIFLSVTDSVFFLLFLF
jgi:hypothetical protein